MRYQNYRRLIRDRAYSQKSINFPRRMKYEIIRIQKKKVLHRKKPPTSRHKKEAVNLGDYGLPTREQIEFVL